MIVDEIHSVVPTERGAHLALSIERLAARCDHPIQRIGLSATQRPLDEVARFLGGALQSTVDSRQPSSTTGRRPLDRKSSSPGSSAAKSLEN